MNTPQPITQILPLSEIITQEFTPGLPVMSLTIRQPWAWLIVNGWKDVENRVWRTHRRGPILIGASKGMHAKEWDRAVAFALKINPAIPVPLPSELQYGGIVGVASITQCLAKGEEADAFPALASSPWFQGPNGFFLERARPVIFHPCRGTERFATFKHAA